MPAYCDWTACHFSGFVSSSVMGAWMRHSLRPLLACRVGLSVLVQRGNMGTRPQCAFSQLKGSFALLRERGPGEVPQD